MYVMNKDHSIGYIKNHISERARLELLAEEAAELSKAALKMIRVLDNVYDAYPVDSNKYNHKICLENLIEEVTDVRACCTFLDISPDEELSEEKLSKMVERIKTRNMSMRKGE